MSINKTCPNQDIGQIGEMSGGKCLPALKNILSTSMYLFIFYILRNKNKKNWKLTLKFSADDLQRLLSMAKVAHSWKSLFYP